jgi:hypothetical protein
MSFYLIFCLSLPFLINAGFVLDLWLSQVPEHAETFFRLLLVYAYIDVLAYPLDIAAQATGNLRRYSISVSIVFLAILPITYVCYALGAIAESVYIVAILISWLSIFIRVTCLHRLIGIQVGLFFRDLILRFIYVISLSVILPIFMHYIMPTSIYSVIANFVVSILSAAIVIYVVGLDRQEKQFVQGICRNVINKLHK